MDDDFKAAAILEFILRQPIEDWLANELFLAIPVSSPLSPCLTKNILVRRLASELSFRSVSERSLHSLELLNDLHHYNDTSDLLRAAYCAVAVECTTCFLRSRPADDHGEFFDAVNRIWNCRVADLERAEEAAGLVSDGLKRARKEMEEAVVDSRVRDALKRRDTKKAALEAVRVYLKEETAKMGPAFLELVAEAIRGGKSSGVDPSLVELKEKSNGSLAKGAVPGTKLNPLTSPEVMKVKEGLRASCLGLQRVVRDPLPDAVALAAEVSMAVPVEMGNSKRNADCVLSSVEEGDEDKDDDGDALTRRSKDTEIASLPNVVGRNATRAQIAEGKRKIGNNRRTASSEDAGANSSGSDSWDSTEINKNDDVVRDRLPDAVEMMASKEVVDDDDDDDEMVSRPKVENPNATHVQVSKGKEKIGDESGTASKDDAVVNSSSSGGRDNEATKNGGVVQKRSIMDWNPTARAYEWEDDSDSSSSESQSLLRKPHLPSSKKAVVSPLKVQGSRNFVGRRKKLRWTIVEEDTLRKAVEKP
ncbi:hypothetical protein DsansV1_C13g0125551 [Dioscorea sansibarensis]